MPSLSNSPAWKQFSQAVLSSTTKPEALRIITAAELEVDLTTQRSSPELAHAARALLTQQGFEQYRRDLFEGAAINWTENRAAWHTALRAPTPPESVAESVLTERTRLVKFVEEVNARNQYRNVVHLGIGGSDWGPRLAFDSLAGLGTRRTLRFASNVDAHAITAALEGLDAHDTLVIISSKSFTTTESLANAACQWCRLPARPFCCRHGQPSGSAQLRYQRRPYFSILGLGGWPLLTLVFNRFTHRAWFGHRRAQ